MSNFTKSVIVFIIGLFITLTANFIPVIYFSSVGYDTDITKIESDPIFTVAAISGYFGLFLVIVSSITAVYFYTKREKKNSI